MPFDGEDYNVVPAIIDKTIEILGPNGERWMRGVPRLRDRRCLGQAVIDAVAALYPTNYALGRKMLEIVGEATGLTDGRGRAAHFNDFPGVTFADIRRVLAVAKGSFVGANEVDALQMNPDQYRMFGSLIAWPNHVANHLYDDKAFTAYEQYAIHQEQMITSSWQYNHYKSHHKAMAKAMTSPIYA